MFSLVLPPPSRSPRMSSAFRLPGLILALLVVLLCLGLFACATTATSPSSTPATALSTFNTLYQDAVSADDIVITTATTALTGGLINATQAAKILAVTDSVKAALDLANSLAQAGNQSAANANLAGSVAAIAVLSSCLTAKPLTVATFDACAVKLLPVVAVTS